MDPTHCDPPHARPYPFAVTERADGWSAAGLQFGWRATAASRERLLRDLAERVARYLFGCAARGLEPDPPRPRVALDLSGYLHLGLEPQVVYVAPARVGAASLAIACALGELGLDRAELARRLGSSEARVDRITDPFYSGHSERTLRRVEAALGRSLEQAVAGWVVPDPPGGRRGRRTR